LGRPLVREGKDYREQLQQDFAIRNLIHRMPEKPAFP
jgi:hypothetical protein